jgi:PAS domain S-box-containing protein
LRKLTLYLLGLLAMSAAALAQGGARDGVLDLRQWSPKEQPIVTMSGDWQFHWRDFVDPASPMPVEDPAGDLVKVPGSWMASADRLGDVEPHGYATYRLKVMLSEAALAEPLGIALRGIRSAYRIWIDDKLLGGLGTPSTDQAGERASVGPAVFTIEPMADAFVLTIHVSNHLSRHNGLKELPRIGQLAALQHDYHVTHVLHAAIAGSILILGFYHIILYASRQHLRYLFFGGLCFMLGLRAVIILHIAEVLLPDAPQEWLWRLEYVTGFLILPAAYHMLFFVFPRDFSRLGLPVTGIIGGLGALMALVGPFAWAAQFANYHQFYVIAALAYMVHCIVLTTLRRRPGSLLALAGVLITAAATIYDFMFYNGMVSSGEVLPYAAFGVTVCFAAIHSMHFRSAVDQIQAFAEAQERTNRQLESHATELRAAGEELAHSEANFRRLAESPLLGVLVIDEAQGPLFANRRAAEIFGYDDTQDTDGMERASLLISPADRPVFEQMIARAGDSAGGQARLYEFEGVRRDGAPVRVQMAADCVDWGNRPAVYVAIADVTEQRRAEAQLAQAQKMEAVGQLTSGVAHDFNNILTVIIGNAEMLNEHPVKDWHEAKPLISAISQAADQGAALTRQLLAFTREQPLRAQAHDIGGRMDDFMAMISRTLGDTIEVVHDFSNNLWPVLTDTAQLENALLNLSLNARDAMPNGGRLEVKARNVHLDALGVAGADGVMPGDYVMLAVTDNGTGMSPQTRDRAFEPFFTTKEFGKGTGLGLSMVYGFARQSGGFAAIESELGVGTTVRIYLPRAPEEAAVAESRQDAAVTNSNGKTVLVVEDDEQVRQLAVTMLATLGFAVLEAADGRAALEILDREPCIDLLLSDVMMPGGMLGPDVAGEARKLHPQIRCIFMSGFSGDALKEAADLGALGDSVHLLAKPFRARDLAAVLDKVMNEAP